MPCCSSPAWSSDGSRIVPQAAPAGELAVVEFFARHRSPVLDALTKAIELVDGPKVTPWLLVAAGLVLFLARRRAMALLVVLLTGVSWLPGHVAKSVFPRPRPPLALDPVVVYHDVASFPSGHTGFAVAAAVAVTFMLTM